MIITIANNVTKLYLDPKRVDGTYDIYLFTVKHTGSARQHWVQDGYHLKSQTLGLCLECFTGYRHSLTLEQCASKDAQHWIYLDGTLYCDATGYCLDGVSSGAMATMHKCDGSASQQWIIGYLDQESTPAIMP